MTARHYTQRAEDRLLLGEEFGPVDLEPAQRRRQREAEGAGVEAGTQKDDLVEPRGFGNQEVIEEARADRQEHVLAARGTFRGGERGATNRAREDGGVWIGEEPILTFGLPGTRRGDPVRGPGVGAGARVGRHHLEV